MLSGSAMSAAAGWRRSAIDERRATCSVPALAHEPALVAFLLINKLNVADVSWRLLPRSPSHAAVASALRLV